MRYTFTIYSTICESFCIYILTKIAAINKKKAKIVHRLEKPRGCSMLVIKGPKLAPTKSIKVYKASAEPLAPVAMELIRAIKDGIVTDIPATKILLESTRMNS